MVAATAPAAVPAPTVAMPVESVGPGSVPAGEKPCPNCSALVRQDDLFCEACGYDFITGALPAPVTYPGGIPVPGASTAHATVTPAPGGGGSATATGSSPTGARHSQPGLTWVAEVWVDPDWFATQESDDPCPSAGMPIVAPLWDTSVLVGRRSVSRNIHPQVDCGADHGVSRRHAQLTTDGQRWWVEDLQSSNGTFVGPAGAPIPTIPVTPGQRVEFAPGDRVYVGAWTRIVVRRATSDEQ